MWTVTPFVLARVEELLNDASAPADAADLPDHDVIEFTVLDAVEEFEVVVAIARAPADVEVNVLGGLGGFDVGVLLEPRVEVMLLVRLLLGVGAGSNVLRVVFGIVCRTLGVVGRVRGVASLPQILHLKNRSRLQACKRTPSVQPLYPDPSCRLG